MSLWNRKVKCFGNVKGKPKSNHQKKKSFWKNEKVFRKVKTTHRKPLFAFP